MKRLKRVDEDAGDVPSPTQNLKRALGHLGQRVGVASRRRISDARLNVAPPAVIGAAETNEVRAFGVIAGQTNRLHHGLGAGHVEGYFVQTGNFAQAADVIGDRRVISAEHRAKVANAFRALGDARFVEVMAEQIDTVRSGQVVENVAVEVGHRYAG